MRLSLLISLSLLLGAAQQIGAQLAPAEDFFNSGAQFYISNNVPAALQRVAAGLKTYPEDEKLKKLEELLKQQQQQQQNQQQDQKDQKDNQDQQKGQSQPKDQPNQKQPDQSEQQKSEEQKKQDEQKKEEPPKQPEPPKPSAEKKDGEEPEDQKGEGQPLAPGQMTPAEAKRLLDSQKGDEQVLQLKPDGKPRDPRKPVKDW